MSDKYPQKCRKIAIVEAFELTRDNFDEVNAWTGGKMHIRESGAIVIDTLEGVMENIIPGDFIMKGVAGEFYRCARQQFLDTYEFTDDDTAQSKDEIEKERDELLNALHRWVPYAAIAWEMKKARQTRA